MTALHGRFSRSQTIIQSGKKYFCLFPLFLQCSFFFFNLLSEWHCGIAIAVCILLRFLIQISWKSAEDKILWIYMIHSYFYSSELLISFLLFWVDRKGGISLHSFGWPSIHVPLIPPFPAMNFISIAISVDLPPPHIANWKTAFLNDIY